METIFRKVSVTESLPKKNKYVHTISETEDSIGLSYFDGKYFLLEKDSDTKWDEITHWLEEIELPSDADIAEHSDNVFDGKTVKELCREEGFEMGAKWVRNKIFHNAKH